MADQQVQDPQAQGLSTVPQTAPDASQGAYGGGYGPSPETPEQDQQQQAVEVEARDQAGLCLALAVEKYVKAGEAALGMGDANGAKDFAAGALALTQAVVLLAPIEHTEHADQVNPGVALPPKHMPPQVSASFSEQAMAKRQGVNQPPPAA